MQEKQEFSKEDEFFMKEALKIAEKGLENGEVPVGCVIVFQGSIIARGHNMTNQKKCALRHCEFECFDEIYEKFKGFEILKESTLYVTCEPCCFCACALLYLGIGKVVCGCMNQRFGGCGSVIEINKINHEVYKNYECCMGLFEKEAVFLLQKFYDQINPHAPVPKTKKRKRAKSFPVESKKKSKPELN